MLVKCRACLFNKILRVFVVDSLREGSETLVIREALRGSNDSD